MHTVAFNYDWKLSLIFWKGALEASLKGKLNSLEKSKIFTLISVDDIMMIMYVNDQKINCLFSIGRQGHEVNFVVNICPRMSLSKMELMLLTSYTP